MSLFRKLVKKSFNLVGYEISQMDRSTRRATKSTRRATLRGWLELVKKLGLSPKTIFDVGVFIGTPGLYDVFDGARYVLIDPLVENEVFMKRICAELGNATYVIAAAWNKEGEILIHVPRQYAGHSVPVGGMERKVPAKTLDAIARDNRAEAPYLIKLDTQGSELEILRGASDMLASTELVILEVSLFPFGGGPELYDVVEFMKERGFVAYDLVDFKYRPIDGALGQIDMAFVREDGALRAVKGWRTAEQRAKSIEDKAGRREELLRSGSFVR